MPEGSSFEDFLANAGFKDEAQFRDYIHETELLQNVVSSLQSDIEVSEEDLTAAYEEQKDQFQTDERVCARHILVETEDAANDLLSQINDGADFAELASANSIDPSGASNGGDLGCFGRGMMVPPFEEAAFTAETDQPVGPVQSQFGYHLILVYDKQEAGTRSFEDVRAELEQSLKQEKFTTMIDALRASATIETFPEALAPVAPATEEVPADDAAPSDDTDTSSSGDATDNSGDTTDNSDDATNTEENSGE
ncbi:MAG: peptidylprolyl isomerase [Trueperaceae bacterium]|nr:peptidylprolyl isomerase [Trueperaceae bacterium]